MFWLSLNCACVAPRLSLCPTLSPSPKWAGRLGWLKSWEGAEPKQWIQTGSRDIQCHITTCSAIEIKVMEGIFVLSFMGAFVQNCLGISMLMGCGEWFPLHCLCFFLFPSVVKRSCLDPQPFLVFFLLILSLILLQGRVGDAWLLWVRVNTPRFFLVPQVGLNGFRLMNIISVLVWIYSCYTCLAVTFCCWSPWRLVCSFIVHSYWTFGSRNF